jgi:sec-independent protein translocase protein TatC
LYFIWEFVSPAMSRGNGEYPYPIFLAGLICFLSGLAFAYFVVLRYELIFLLALYRWHGVLPEWTFDNYVSFVTAMMVAFGVVFEFPVMAALLAKFDLLTASTRSRSADTRIWLWDPRRRSDARRCGLADLALPADGGDL